MAIQSILDGFYEEIMARITLLVPKIKHFDLYYGQYDHPQLDENGNTLNPGFNRPACFFEWPQDIPLTPLGLKRKVTDIVFTLHLVQDVIQEIDRRTPVAVRAKGHEHTALINDVQIALEGFSGNTATNFKHFSTIGIMGIKPYIYSGAQTIHLMGFKVRIVVDAAKQFYTKLADLTPPVEADDQIDSGVEEI